MSETLVSVTTAVDSLHGPPIDSEVMFSNHKGIRRQRVEKRQRSLLAKIGPHIGPFLAPGERILLITTACSPASFLEQYTAGLVIYYLKRALLVFTDRRVFHVPTTANFRYRESIARILYGDCKEVRARGSRLTFIYKKSGKKETFLYPARPERRKLKALLQTLSLSGPSSQNGERTHLCPRCTAELIPNRYVCPQCYLAFKNYERAKFVSIVYPGGGYFYTGHPVLGALDALTETALSLGLLGALWGWIKGEAGAGQAVIIVGLVLAFEKIVSVYHSSHFVKEFIPAEKGVQGRALGR
jgi:hypothetical protein